MTTKQQQSNVNAVTRELPAAHQSRRPNGVAAPKVVDLLPRGPAHPIALRWGEVAVYHRPSAVRRMHGCRACSGAGAQHPCPVPR